MIETGGNNMFMPVAPAGWGGNGNFGLDNSTGSWWILLLFILLGNNGGYNWGGNNGMPMWMMSNSTNNDVQRGFDQQALVTGINNVSTSINGLSGQMANGFAQAEISANSRQMADMNQNFQGQITNLQSFNALQSALSQCCCNNQLATERLNATILSENCSDRNALNEAMMQLYATNTANTQRLVDTITMAAKGLDDKLCKLELDHKNNKIADLERQITESNIQNMINAAMANKATA